MPSYKKSKYTPAQTQEITMHTLDVLANSDKPMTIQQICESDIFLINQTTQKMSRVLNELYEHNVIFKTKDRASGRMVYITGEALERQGYDLNKVVC